jgi:hypothetical protein
MWGIHILKNGDTMERLEAKLDAMKEALEVHEARQEEQFKNMREYFDLKFTIDTCGSCSASKRIEKSEEDIKVLSKYQDYIIGGLVIIGIIIPYILPKLF